jgi:hypothetical protein
MEIPRTRVTQKRRVRFAERQTRRRQVGGGRVEPLATLRPGIFTAYGNDSSRAFLSNIVTGTKFDFLLEDAWFTRDTAAKNYATLISEQDELFDLALKKIKSRDALDISDGTSDANLLTAVMEAEDGNIKVYMGVLDTIARCIILDDVTAERTMRPAAAQRIAVESFLTSSNNQPKIFYNIKLSDSIDVLRTKLINILLYPKLMENTAIHAMTSILKTLKPDERTRDLIDISNDDLRNHVHNILADKYTWYLLSSAATLTNDKLRDSFCLWSVAKTGEGFWYDYFSKFLEEYTTDISGTRNHLEINSLAPSFRRATNFEELNLFVDHSGDRRDDTNFTADTIICSFILAIVLDRFVESASRVQIVEEFAVDRTGDPLSATRLGRDAERREAADLESLTGMLPSATWGQPILEGSAITFRQLLNHLNPRYIHFLLHLTHVLFKDD